MKYSKAKNEAWMSNLETHVNTHIDDMGFTSNHLAHLMSISQRQLYRKLKDLAGVTPNEYLNQTRFRKAKELLQQQNYDTVMDVAKAVGFKDVVYFSRQFKKRFGELPSRFLD